MTDIMSDASPSPATAGAVAQQAEPQSLPEGGLFRSLENPSFRKWSAGALVSNIGAWMQRIAQDWLVLTVLTDNDASAVGIVTALQFGPQLLLIPWTGTAADRYDRRKLLMATQGAMALLALALGLLTILGLVRTWHVYLFAALLGGVTAFDTPVRHTFVADMVGESHLSNAVALNASSYNASRLLGPAVAGLVIAAVGSGWAFILNAVSFAAVLWSLIAIRPGDLIPRVTAEPGSGGVAEGFRYIMQHRDLKTQLLMLTIFFTVVLNFPVFISTMAASVFHLGARGFGLLTSAMAVGSVTGALLAARRPRPTLQIIVSASVIFGIALLGAAVAPNTFLFALALPIAGAASQTVTTSLMALMQMTTEPVLRGRVMALLLTVSIAGQPVGAPLIGWIANAAGPRLAVMTGAAAGLLAAVIGFRHLRAQADSRRPSRT